MKLTFIPPLVPFNSFEIKCMSKLYSIAHEYLLYSILITWLMCPLTGGSQSLPMKYGYQTDQLRRAQLEGKVDSTVSFMQMPVQSTYLKNLPDNYYSQYGLTIFGIDSLRSSVKVLPVSLLNDFNSRYPFGSNNGSLVRSRGLQSSLNFGIFARFGVLSLQISPEINYVQNREYDGFPEYYDDRLWRGIYIRTYNIIDLPESFGTSSKVMMFPGQSSLRVSYGAFSLGLSTENIWWGPGKQNSLIMTNNAAGFMHLTFNTRRPARTPIGSFEGQLIAGRLENSAIDGPLPDREVNSLVIIDKSTDWRYLSGITVTYQPKWIPGLFLGATRVIQNYADSIKSQNEPVPVLSNFFRENDPNPFNDGSRDQLISFFMRWLWTEAMAEIYFEVGRSDAAWNMRDFLMSPEHASGYIIGMSKLIELAQPGQYMQFEFETTRLENSKTGTIRAEPDWYQNGRLTHGYTHLGEVIGSGIGPGSNHHFAAVSWVNGSKQIGLEFNQIYRDNDFYFDHLVEDEKFKKWVDIGIGPNISWFWDRIMLNAKYNIVTAKNYQWEAGKDKINHHLRFSLNYLFK